MKKSTLFNMYSRKKIPQQLKNERVILFLRRHKFIFLKDCFFFVLGFFFPVIIYFILKNLHFYFEGEIFKALFLLLASAYYLMILLLFFTAFVDYHLDVWIVTNQRILNIEQKALFSRTISELKVNRIQDITSDVNGILETFLNFGNVHIQTAGTEERFIFKQVPDPSRIRKKILTLLKQSKHFEEIMKKKDKIKT